jgi:hypothetical protein
VVVRTRGRVLDGIDPEQYQQTVTTLARMAENLT